MASSSGLWGASGVCDGMAELAFKEIERASVLELQKACKKRGIAVDKFSRFELVVRLAADVRPELVPRKPEAESDLVQAANGDAAPAGPQGEQRPLLLEQPVPAREEVEKALAALTSGSVDAASVPEHIQKCIDDMPEDTRHSAVGARLKAENPEVFSKLLVACAQAMEGLAPKRVAQKPKGCKSKVWEYFNFFDGIPNMSFCRLCCPPDLPESQWLSQGIVPAAQKL